MWASIQSWISDSCAFPVFICIMRYLHTYCMTSYRAFCHVTASDLLVQELFSLNGTGPLCSVGLSYGRPQREEESVCVCVWCQFTDFHSRWKKKRFSLCQDAFLEIHKLPHQKHRWSSDSRLWSIFKRLYSGDRTVSVKQWLM